MKLSYTVPPERDGAQLKYILRRDMKVSAGLLRRAKAGGHIRINGEDVFVTRTVGAGDVAELELTEETPAVPAEEGPLDVLYEDPLLLAVNKPAGMFVHPTPNVITGTLLNRVLFHTGGVAHAVNRLDRDTSGVVLFAKNAWAAAAPLELRKEYQAIVFGCPQEMEGAVELPIARASERDLMRVVREDGSQCRSEWRVERVFDGFSLLRLTPVTGRTHQLRVHCLAMGCPILGDKLYATEASAALSARLGIETQALHARRLEFTHPVTGRVTVEAVPERVFFRSFGAGF